MLTRCMKTGAQAVVKGSAMHTRIPLLHQAKCEAVHVQLWRLTYHQLMAAQQRSGSLQTLSVNLVSLCVLFQV